MLRLDAESRCCNRCLAHTEDCDVPLSVVHLNTKSNNVAKFTSVAKSGYDATVNGSYQADILAYCRHGTETVHSTLNVTWTT